MLLERKIIIIADGRADIEPSFLSWRSVSVANFCPENKNPQDTGQLGRGGEWRKDHVTKMGAHDTKPRPPLCSENQLGLPSNQT